MAVSTYKGYILIATGDEVDTWGVVLNAQAIERIDRNVGGFASKSLSNINVILSATENQNLILQLTGTLTGAVLITSTLQGMMIIENNCTGAFAVTFTNGVGSPITLPNATTSLVIADAAGGARAAINNAPEFPSGTRMLFQQTAAPTGWTKDVTHNDKALRVVSGSVVNGGTVAFETAFASQTVAGTVGNTALTVAQLPPHTHGVTTNSNNNSNTNIARLASSAGAGTINTDSTGSGDTHTHTFTGTAINLDVAFVDVIIASKN